MQKYIIQLIFCIGIVILINFFYPEGRYKKNIRFVTALIVILHICIPLIDFVKTARIDESILKNSIRIECSSFETENGNLNDTYRKAVLREYCTTLKTDICMRLEEKGVHTYSIEVYVSEQDDETFGNIEQIHITVDEDGKNIAQNTISDFYTVDKEHIIINADEKR